MLLISSPAKAWEEIRLEEDRRKVFTAFVYPMIGLCGLSVFIGSAAQLLDIMDYVSNSVMMPFIALLSTILIG